MQTRILLAEDFEPFRRYVGSILREHPAFLVVGEAMDGITAVAKARQLKPDLVLMDIGMPLLSGLDAARQIRCVSSDSIIAFLTEQNSPAVVKEALNIGARAYLVKSYCGSELLPALKAVLQGREFISKCLFGIP